MGVPSARTRAPAYAGRHGHRDRSSPPAGLPRLPGSRTSFYMREDPHQGGGLAKVYCSDVAMKETTDGKHRYRRLWLYRRRVPRWRNICGMPRSTSLEGTPTRFKGLSSPVEFLAAKSQVLALSKNKRPSTKRNGFFVLEVLV